MHHLLDVVFKVVGRYEALSAALAVVAILVFLALPPRARTLFDAVEQAFSRLAERPVLSSLFLAALLIGGRLLLMPLLGLPAPIVADEFSLMLQADTYAHGRLTNPYTSLPPSFSEIYGLITPTFASMYPVLRSAPAAIAEALGLYPWFGALFTMAALSIAVYFLIRRFLAPGYALLMALLVIIRFGFFSGLSNSYGATPTIPLGGVLLLLGYLEFDERPSVRSGLFIGLGVFLLMTAHPFQALLFAGPILLALAYKAARRLSLDFTPVALAGAAASILILAGVGLTAAHNKAVTGSWSVFPYDLYRVQYGMVPAFMTGPPPAKPVVSVDYDVINKYHAVDAKDYYKERSLTGVIHTEVSRYRRAVVFNIGLPLLLPFVLGFGFFRGRLALLAAGVILAVGVGLITWGHAGYSASVLGLVWCVVAQGFQRLRSITVGGAAVGIAISRGLVVAIIASLGYPIWALASDNWGAFNRRELDLSVCCFLKTNDLHAEINRYLADAGVKKAVLFHRESESFPGLYLVFNNADLDTTPYLWVYDDQRYNDQVLSRFPGRSRFLVTAKPDRSVCLSSLDAPAGGNAECLRKWRRLEPPGITADAVLPWVVAQ